MQRQINRTTRVVLKSMDETVTPSGPVYAVNWFDTRADWFYDFYNILAAPPLRKAGGHPLFKGTRLKTLSRRGSEERDRLLIVRYRSGEALLDLMQSGYFQVISLLRLLAVRRFSFVLHARADAPARAGADSVPEFGDKGYALHHFRSPHGFHQELGRIGHLLEGEGIRIFFAGEAALKVSTAGKSEEPQALPFVTHKLVLFEAESRVALEQTLTSADYSRFCDELATTFLGAGSAATGIADLIQVALRHAGLSGQEARRRLWFVDQAGLVVKARADLAPHNLPYAHDVPGTGFVEAIGRIKHAYVFPGIGLGAVACNAKGVSDEMFLVSAHALAGMVTEADLEAGSVYPPLSDIRKVSLSIAVAAAEKAWEQGLARDPRPADVEQMIAGLMYSPDY